MAYVGDPGVWVLHKIGVLGAWELGNSGYMAVAIRNHDMGRFCFAIKYV
jgi:hypothetical protein